MSAGCVHQKASLILSAGLLAGALRYGSLEPAIGALVGIFVGPDQDVDRGNISNKIIKGGMGFLGLSVGYWMEKLWNWFWYPYRISLKHGGPLSHLPIISTWGRIAYIYFMLIVIPHALVYVLFSPTWDLWAVLDWYWNQIIERDRLIMGLMGSDFIHWGLDILTSENSKQKRRAEIFGIALASNRCK